MYTVKDTYTGLVKELVPLPLGSEQVAVQGRIAHAPTFIRRCTSICTSHVTSTPVNLVELSSALPPSLVVKVLRTMSHITPDVRSPSDHARHSKRVTRHPFVGRQ